MTDFILVVVLAVIIGGAAAYVYKAKKTGVKCIGCPNGCRCSGAEGAVSSCGCDCESGKSCH